MDAPIGFFDSGIGGLSIWKAILDLLPYENTYYLSDSFHAPYGEKTVLQIRNFCKKNTEFLLKKKCKMIVVACNTATTNAIAFLREKYPQVLFVGVEPAIKPAALKSKKKCIGILATQGTLYSKLFSETSKSFLKSTEIIEQKGTGLVKLIENGKIDSPEMRELLKKYIQPMLEKKIDYLVLGCSHYVFLSEKIKEISENKFEIMDAAKPVAKRIDFILKEKNIYNTSKKKAKHTIITNANLEILNFYIQKLGLAIKIQKKDF